MKDLLESIKHHEGFVEHVYDDSLGIPTIGYGFAIKDLVLQEDLCDEILLRKLRILGRSVMSKFPFFDSLPSDCKTVLMEMCYQLGVTGVSKFKKALKAMEDGDWEKAADEMLDSKWAKQTPNRAKEMSDIIRSLHEEKSSTKGDSNT
jgi:lysozyme|tara:strand:- start:704 stop:1147 length:444 start_codon:yes stop_codon:yes gene_type:complete